MNEQDVRCQAVVDWCEIAFNTQTPFVAWRMRDQLRKSCNVSFVTPINSESGLELAGYDANRPTSSFRARLHDPARMNDLIKLIRRLKEDFSMVASPTIFGIEISVDVYIAGADRSELAETVANLYWGSTGLVSENRRIYSRGKGNGKAIPQHTDSFIRHLAKDYTLGVGDKDADKFQRMYVKTTDNNKQVIPEKQWRARTEITLRGASLPCTSTDDMTNYRFETLTKPTGNNLFRFRVAQDGLSTLDRIVMNRMVQVGERKKRSRVKADRTGCSGSQLYGSGTKADAYLNEKTRNALRELSNRWRRNV